jgi:hypothetical protein
MEVARRSRKLHKEDLGGACNKHGGDEKIIHRLVGNL